MQIKNLKRLSDDQRRAISSHAQEHRKQVGASS